MRLAGLTLLAACSFHSSVAREDAAPLVVGGEAGVTPEIDAAIDAPPDAPSCTTDNLFCAAGATATMCNGACWIQCADPANEYDAAGRCDGWGGKLAPLRSAADETCATFGIGASWTGYEQQYVFQQQVDEDWSWNSDGLVSPYIHWAAGQPNDGDGFESGAESCAYRSTSGSWQDTGCLNTYKFSCRR